MLARRWLVLLCVCVGLFVALALFKILQIRGMIAFAATFPEPSATVEQAVVRQERWQSTAHVMGEVLALQQLTLRNELPGTIAALSVAPGATVEAGQIVLQLDSSREQAEWRAALAEAELAQLDLQRYQKLISQSASSREQYDQARAQYAMASARAQALQAVIDKKTLRAPFAAQASLHNWQVGQYLAADTAVMDLTGIAADVDVDFYLPQAQLPQQQDAAVTVQLGDVSLSGQVVARNAAVNTTSRHWRLRARLYNASALLQPGMLVPLTVVLAPARDVLTVPVTAVQRDNEGAYVYVLQQQDGRQRALKQRVTIGEEREQRVVVEGLAAGVFVAAKGSYKLQQGMLANIAVAAVQ